jgi:hypothetical protein
MKELLNKSSYPAEVTTWTDADYERWADEYLEFCRLNDVDTREQDGEFNKFPGPWDPTDGSEFCECDEDCTPCNCDCPCHWAHLEIAVESLF